MNRSPAPLLGVEGAPTPPVGKSVFITARDGVRLRAAVFAPEGTPRGSVILSPGRSEYIEKYLEVIGELTEKGFVVLVHDWRGQGLSDRLLGDPLKGHARGWRPFLADYDLLLDAFAAELPRPWIGLGHSMGGGLLALALAEGETRLDAAVFSAPMLGLKFGRRSRASVEWVSFLMNFFGRSKAYVRAAADPLDEVFDDTALTRDHARWLRNRAQIAAHARLRLGGVTWGWLAMALTLCARVAASRRIDALSIPVLVVLAGEDSLLVNLPGEAFADRAPAGAYVVIPNACHEILMETDSVRQAFWTAFDALADKAAPRPQSASADTPVGTPTPGDVASSRTRAVRRLSGTAAPISP